MQVERLDRLSGEAKAKLGRAGIGGIVLFCLVVYLPGFFSLSTVDREEARVAQASRQMYESVALPPGQRDAKKHGGRLVVPTIQDRPRLNVPPLIHWAQTASAAVMSRGNSYRDDIWMYRLPSLIAAIVVVCLTRRLGTLMFDSGAGRLAAVLVAVCPIMGWQARQATADMALLAWTTWAMLELWKVYAWGRVGSAGTVVAAERPGLQGAASFWIAIAGGLMTQGPITPLIVGMTTVALCITGRRCRWLLDLKPLLALPILGLAVGPWAYAASRQVDFATYLETIGRAAIGIGPDSTGWTPPGYHSALAMLLSWPGSILTGLGLFVAWKLGRGNSATGAWRDGHPSYLFLLAWIVPGWLLFETIIAKLPSSPLPMYPALAILGARAILAADVKALHGVGSKFGNLWTLLWLLAGAGLVFAVIGGLITRMAIWPSSMVGNVGLAIILIIGGGAMLRLLKASWGGIVAGKFARAAVAAVLVMVVFWWIVPTAILPRVLGFSGQIGGELQRIDPGAGRPIASVGYREDSLVFLTRGRLDRLNSPDVPAWLAAHPDGLLVREKEQTLQAGPAMRELGAAAGLNYSTGRMQRVAIEEIAR